jgi:hypothetical protein
MSDIAQHAVQSVPLPAAQWQDTQSLKSLELIRACGLRADDPLIDVSGGSPLLICSLLDAGFRNLTVMNASFEVLEALREGGLKGDARVTLIAGDVPGFHCAHRYALWHDRGVFHLLRHAEERRQYIESAQEALRPEGYLVIATAGPQGPLQCGGLPVRRYEVTTLAEEFGGQFELAEHSLATHHAGDGELHQYLHCRFRRHAPRLPS